MKSTSSPTWLLPAQIGWITAISIVVLFFLAGAVVYFNQLRELCTAPVEYCLEFDYATPAWAAQLESHNISLDEYAVMRAGIRIVYSLLPISLGLLIFLRRRSEPIALLVSLFLVTFGTVGEMQAALVETFPILHLPAEAIEIVGAGLLLPLFFGLFPNGRMVPRLYWLIVIFIFLSYLFTDPSTRMGEIISWVGWLSILIGGPGAQIYRYYRVSTAVERKQTRWVLFGMGLMATMLAGVISYSVILGDPTTGVSVEEDFLGRFIFLAIANFSFQFIYLTIGMAILRSKLFDIDLIIRRTLQYSLLTGSLVTIYFGTIVIVQTLLGQVTDEQSPLIVVFSTLIIAALFSPLRHRTQTLIDRRFYRRKYDAQQTLAQFAQIARDEVDMERLSAVILMVIDETMQPEKVSVWLTGTVKRKGDFNS